MATAFVIGATGDVGQGMVEGLLAGGHRVVAAARNEERLRAMQERLAGRGALYIVTGSVDDDAKASALKAAMIEAGGAPLGVATALSSPEWNSRMRVIDSDEATLMRLAHDNLFLHFNAAKAFIPALTKGGTFVAINGGLADFILPGMGHMSIVQAAERAMFEVIAKEVAEQGVHVRVLGLYSMISGQRSRANAKPEWVTAEQVGARVNEFISTPEKFEGAVHSLRSKQYQ